MYPGNALQVEHYDPLSKIAAIRQERRSIDEVKEQSIQIHCAFDKIVSVGELKPNPKNPNKHPADQVELLAKVIEKQGWRQPIKVSKRSGYIVSGHGRYEAAVLLDCFVPIDLQDYPSDEDELADLLADNRIAEMAEMDNKLLAEIFADIEKIDDATLTGYFDNEIKNIIANFSEPDFDELDNEEDVDDEVSVKITFDTYKDYSRVEAEVKEFVENIGARMVLMS